VPSDHFYSSFSPSRWGVCLRLDQPRVAKPTSESTKGCKADFGINQGLQSRLRKLRGSFLIRFFFWIFACRFYLKKPSPPPCLQTPASPNGLHISQFPFSLCCSHPFAPLLFSSNQTARHLHLAEPQSPRHSLTPGKQAITCLAFSVFLLVLLIIASFCPLEDHLCKTCFVLIFFYNESKV
jgi:hypothetical protein